MIKIGDRVKIISGTESGTVVSVKNSTVEVDVMGGFVVPYMITDLVVVSEKEEIEILERIGVSDEKPGRKRKEKKEEAITPEQKKSTPAKVNHYGRISLVEDDYEEELLDMDKINENYRRNRLAAEQLEREFEEARRRDEEAKKRITEESSVEVEDKTEEVVEEKPKYSETTLEELAEKAKLDMAKPVTQKKKVKKDDTEVIDLHAHEILTSTEGMKSGEIITAQLARFTVAMDLAIKSGKHGKIVFIHGVGKGRLRAEIQRLLRTNYPKIMSQDASFSDYGFGAIMIFY